MGPRSPKLRLASLSGAEVFPLSIPGENRLCNPSIAKSDRGIFCIIRSVNYDLDSHGNAIIPPLGFKSSNWLAELDADFHIVCTEQIDETVIGIDQRSENRIEDCRLFRWKDSWWCSATCVLQDQPFVCQIALCRLEGCKVVEWHLLASPLDFWVEKNWMPCVDGDRLKWIYWLDPLQVLTFNSGRTTYQRLGRYGRLEGWAGSSPFVRYRGNWLCVVHHRKVSSKKVVYAHRFVELTGDFAIRRASKMFTFEGEAIEFCAGLYLDGHHAVLSYGVWDRHARLMRIEISAVEAMLRPYRMPRLLAVALSELRRRMNRWMRYRWIRHPGKQLRALRTRWRGKLGV